MCTLRPRTSKSPVLPGAHARPCSCHSAVLVPVRAATRPLLVRRPCCYSSATRPRPCCYSSATRPAAVPLLVRYSSGGRAATRPLPVRPVAATRPRPCCYSSATRPVVVQKNSRPFFFKPKDLRATHTHPAGISSLENPSPTHTGRRWFTGGSRKADMRIFSASPVVQASWSSSSSSSSSSGASLASTA